MGREASVREKEVPVSGVTIYNHETKAMPEQRLKTLRRRFISCENKTRADFKAALQEDYDLSQR